MQLQFRQGILMKKICVILFILVISIRIKAQWIEVESNNSIPLYSFYFTNENIGYAVGGLEGMSNYQVILKTTNKGLTWNSLISTDSYSLKSVCFTSNDTGYVVGNYGLILKTVDAGLNWMPQISGTTSFLNSVFFIDKHRGYIVGNYGTILKTIDGGTTWTKISLTGGTPNLYSVFFTDSTTGYAVGSGGTWGYEELLILNTSNAGINWITQWSDTTVVSYYTLRAIFFTDSITGYAVGANAGKGIILRTINGGINWVTQYESQEETALTSIYFPTKDTGYAVGGFNIFKTKDAGINWTSQDFDLFTESGLWQIYFTNTLTGYLTNGHGKIFMTTNGGEQTNVIGYDDINEYLNVFPNPVKDEIRLETSLSIKRSLLTIYSISGQELIKYEIKDDKMIIPFPYTEKGLYLLKIENDKIIMVKKIIKV